MRSLEDLVIVAPLVSVLVATDVFVVADGRSSERSSADDAVILGIWFIRLCLDNRKKKQVEVG